MTTTTSHMKWFEYEARPGLLAADADAAMVAASDAARPGIEATGWVYRFSEWRTEHGVRKLHTAYEPQRFIAPASTSPAVIQPAWGSQAAPTRNMNVPLLLVGVVLFGLGVLWWSGQRVTSSIGVLTQPPVAPVGNRVTITRSGSNGQTTDKFALSGDYRVDWSATGPGSSICYHGAYLMPSGDLVANQTVTGKQTATTHAYGLATGFYYLDINSSCPQWSFTLTPI